MARMKLSKTGKSDNKEDDSNIMFPDQTIEIDGREILVREYLFFEGLRLLPYAEGIIQGLLQCKEIGKPTVAEINLIIAENIDAFSLMLSQSCGVEEDWIESLSQEDGQRLLMKWWQVNGPFYLLNAVMRSVVEQVESDGET